MDNYIVYVNGRHNGVAGYTGSLPYNQTPAQALTKRLQQWYPGKTVSVRKVMK